MECNAERKEYKKVALREVLQQGPVTLLATGESMLPLIKGGEDKVVIVPFDGKLSKHDVVLFQQGDKYVLHRVVKIDDHLVYTKGDNNARCEIIPYEAVLGRLQIVIKKSGNRWLCEDKKWEILSLFAVLRRNIIAFGKRYFNAGVRRRIAPYYFILLFVLMWAPLNGLGVVMDNYLLGVRLDHLLHASVYIPCAWFLSVVEKRSLFYAWLNGIIVALVTEFGQMVLPYRGFDVNDIVANFVGVTLGWIALHCYVGKRRRLE